MTAAPPTARRGRLPGLSRMSLRARLMLLTIVLLAAGLAISDIGTVLLLGGPLQDRVDNQLRAAAGVMAQRRTLPQPPPPVGAQHPAVPQGNVDWPGAVISDIYVGYLNAAGDLTYVMRSTTFTGPDPPQPHLDTQAVAAPPGHVFTLTAPGGSPTWRAIALPRDTNNGSDINNGSRTNNGSVVVAVVLNETITAHALLRFGLIDAALPCSP
jgi:two-component system OmpR family sensor kinase